mmetsp:Transcript_152/g.381  ORF Transcript_152/g.381 Transcript_152/m.381 type:complete len:283 (+) Transcript_152:72-920(+)|eukprot:CAMPEP_0168193744 /NCGR_PEP_ID=MMETSP0139_2-20121125/18779_1 /TAXON_ID=44445 /ORGANISM="Pseudo-nitzschia australis, Strain 10249 10 AB" /LENGTH=282 /DNA_ID=CAMNT_0008117139 /DNA_START=61 /DNA_END=909 /DNA_ORIENTATION=-
MTNFILLIANLVAFLCISDINFTVAKEDDNVFEEVADGYHSYHLSKYEENSGPVESTGVRGSTDIANGIYRGEAASPSYNSRQDIPISGRSGRLSGSTKVKTDIVDSSEEQLSCVEDTENTFALNEDIRLELSAIDTRYLESASIENACNRDGKISNCDFDFRLLPNKLQEVCEKDGDNFYETEHSIQCHNPSTKESLYYQYDHYPSCFSAACEQIDVKQLVAGRIDSITQTLAEYLEMSCFADDDILRQANDASLIESAGVKILWHGIQMLPIATFLISIF